MSKLFYLFLFYSTIVFGPPGNTRFPFVFLVSNLIFFAYPMYVFKVSVRSMYKTFKQNLYELSFPFQMNPNCYQYLEGCLFSHMLKHPLVVFSTERYNY